MLYCYTQISISASNVHYFEPTICGCLEWQEAVLIDPSLNRTEAYLDEAGINLKRLELAMNAVIFPLNVKIKSPGLVIRLSSPSPEVCDQHTLPL